MDELLYLIALVAGAAILFIGLNYRARRSQLVRTIEEASEEGKPPEGEHEGYKGD